MVTFGSFALHGPPPREEGGKHQGPEARPKVKEHWERERERETPPPHQCHPCSWNGQPAPAAFPEMVMGGRGGRLSPHRLGHRRLQTLSPSALSPLAPQPGTQESTSPSVPRRLGRGWVRSGCPGPPLGQAGLVVQYATWCRKSPPHWPGRQEVGGSCPPRPRRPPGGCRHLIGLHLGGSAAPG